MTTWTSKRVLAGLALMGLAGCTEGPGLALAPAAAPGTDNTRSETVLAQGRVAVRPPSGFCIDPDSVSNSGRTGFAMIARCSRLGGSSGLSSLVAQSPAVMTISTRPWTKDSDDISSADIAAAYPDGTIDDTRDGPPAAMVRATSGTARVAGLDDIHWRSAFVVNQQLVVMGLYAPKDSAALGSNGARLLGQFVHRTDTASERLPTPE